MKFLKTIRFDPSDAQVFEHAAGPDEWAIPGGFQFDGAAKSDLAGKAKQAFSNGFLSLESLGRSTFVSVADIDTAQVEALRSGLASHLIEHFGAPSKEDAEAAAAGELDFVLEMCSEVAINSIFTVRRFFDEDGVVREEFRIVDAPGAKPHARVWEVVED